MHGECNRAGIDVNVGSRVVALTRFVDTQPPGEGTTLPANEALQLPRRPSLFCL